MTLTICYSYIIAFNLKNLFLPMHYFWNLVLVCSVMTTPISEKKMSGDCRGEKKGRRKKDNGKNKQMTWISSLSVIKTCQRWNPEYPPGNPGKPHPVGCALNGEAEIEIKEDRENIGGQSDAHKADKYGGIKR